MAARRADEIVDERAGGNVEGESTPIANVNASKEIGPMIPAMVASPRTRVAASSRICVKRTTLRRSTISARLPASRPSSREGAVLAVCTSATISADGVSVAISHAATVACMV